MPYRVTDATTTSTVKELVKAELTRLSSQNEAWTPQKLQTLLEDRGIKLSVPTLRRALDALVADGILESVP